MEELARGFFLVGCRSGASIHIPSIQNRTRPIKSLSALSPLSHTFSHDRYRK